MNRNEKRELRKKAKAEKKENKKNAKEEEIEHRGTLREQYSNLLFAYKFIWRSNKKLFLYRIPLMLMQSLQSIVPIFFVRAVLNEITEGKNIKLVLIYAGAMALFTFVIKLLTGVISIYDQREHSKLGFNMSKELARAVTEMSYSTLENPETQNYMYLAFDNRFDRVLSFTTAIVGSVITMCGMGAVAASLSPTVLVIIIVASAIKFIIDRIMRMYPHKYNDARTGIARLHGYYMGVMDGASEGKEIRINNMEKWICEKEEKCWREELFPIDSKFQQIMLAFQSATGFVGTVQDILIYLVLAITVIGSTMTVGDFSMYLSAAATFSGAVMGISVNYSYLILQTSWYLKEYRWCLDLVEKAKADGGHTHMDMPENVEIEFRNVSFKYPRTDRLILDNVNITIKRGETLSIVGANGAGKSTFVKLLCRFYEPTEGEILVNGIPAGDIPLVEYYKLLGVVFQDFYLFKFTVAENIIMDTESDPVKLSETIRKCGLESRIATLPHGTDTYIYKAFDPDGIELSGGEGQKVAIARAVYRGAPIVIFDEPTSALDPIAEYDIYRNFHDLAENRTAIYISHRLSSTRFTDKTAVFKSGRIAEYGTHEELMNIENGIYRDMFATQAKYYEK